MTVKTIVGNSPEDLDCEIDEAISQYRTNCVRFGASAFHNYDPDEIHFSTASGPNGPIRLYAMLVWRSKS